MLINQGEQQCQWTTSQLVEAIYNIVIASVQLLSPTFCSKDWAIYMSSCCHQGATANSFHLEQLFVCFLSMCLNKCTEESLISVDIETKSLNPPA